MASLPDSPYLFVGGNSCVFAIDKNDGEIAWDIQLKTGWFKTGSNFVTLSEGLDYLFAFSHGIAFCIDKHTGKILWQKVIKELKDSTVSLAVDATLLGLAHDASASDVAELSDADGDGGDGGDGGGD
ncbi:MAG: hypothetical protein AAF750_18620 [Planctomycetota bacterium]